MRIVKSAAVVAISGFLMGASMSAWAGMPTDNMEAPSHIEVIAAANGPLSATEGALEPSMALQATRQVRSNCQASHIYGADDVVGDKNSCIMGGYAIPGAGAYSGIGMATGVR